MAARGTGTTKWFNPTKGFGFIETSLGEDVFVHQSSIKSEGYRSLAEGEAVEFELETDHTGRKKAINVSGPGGAAVKGAPRQDNGGYGGGRGGGGYGGGGFGGGGGYNDGGYQNGGYQDGGYGNGGGGYGGGRGGGGYGGGRGGGGYGGGGYGGGGY